MDDIISRLQKKDTYQIFAQPVDAEVVPDYYDVITNPMDFATMKKRLAKGLYKTWDDFQVHIELVRVLPEFGLLEKGMCGRARPESDCNGFKPGFPKRLKADTSALTPTVHV